MVKRNNNSYKKTIAVFMLMITAFVFLSVNVYAETDFSYNVSVSNQDSINGVVITLKANRGSLVNSGTAALGYSGYCPVLVSVTLQNTNNQNVLINNLKFKVTTNSSGNFSNIISFEQLSSDLIVAETPYDLNNYISIVPSSQYSYGTGIVVPANSSMYMVCIMNVYANYDTVSNQWQVPSLHYIGYDSGLTVTAGDYNSAGIPVDLTQVIESLSDLISTVSTSQELQDLIDAVSFNGTGYVYTAPNYNNAVYNRTYPDTTNVMATMNFRRFIGRPYLITIDVDNNTTNDTSYVNGAKRYPFYIKIATNISNNSKLYFESKINDIFPTNTVVCIDYFYSDVYSGMYRDNQATTFQFKHRIGNYTYLKSGWYNTYIVGHIDVQYNSELTFPAVDTSIAIRDISINSDNIYLPLDEYTILRDLYLSYQNVNGLDDSSDISNDVADVSDSNHTIEENYYSANASAIEATGLSNYRFSNEQNNGIGQVADDFMLLWNALGSWNGVYIFSLTMALATFIMRHGGLFTIKRETSDKGGEGD